jgi:hypothetical protein
MIRAEYHILERYEADTARAEANVQRLAKATGAGSLAAEAYRRDLARAVYETERFARAAGTAKTALTALAAYGAVAGIRSMVGGLSELEQATQGVAGAFFINDAVQSFDAGMRRAEGAVQRFRQMAKASPGDTKDFLAIYSTMLPVMLQANRGDAAMEELTKRGLFLKGLAPQSSYEEIAQSLGMVLGGAAGQDTVVWRMLQRQLGGDVQKWNELAKSNPGEAFDRLSAALAPLEAVADRAGQSFTGLLGTLSDIKDQTLHAAGEGLFEALKDDMADAAEWADRNDAAIKRWAKSVGEDLVGAYNALKAPVGFALENAEALALLWGAGQVRNIGAGVRGSGIGLMTGGERDPVKIAAKMERGWRLSGLPYDVQWNPGGGYGKLRTVGYGDLARREWQPLEGAERERAVWAGVKGGAGRALDLAGQGLSALGTVTLAAETVILGWNATHDLTVAFLDAIDAAGVRSAQRADVRAVERGEVTGLGAWGILGAKDSFEGKWKERRLREIAASDELVGTLADLDNNRAGAHLRQVEEEYAAFLRRREEATAKLDEAERKAAEELHKFSIEAKAAAAGLRGFAAAGIGGVLSEAARKQAEYRAAAERLVGGASERSAWAKRMGDDFVWKSLGDLVVKGPEVHIGKVEIQIQRATNPERTAILTRDVMLRAALAGPRLRAGNALGHNTIVRGF